MGPATREERGADLVRFLRTIQRPDRPIEEVGEDTSLVESGLIDSLAVLEIVTYLEDTYRIDFAGRGLDADELASIGRILDLIERESA